MRAFVSSHSSAGFGGRVIKWFSNAGRKGPSHNAMRFVLTDEERRHLLRSHPRKARGWSCDECAESIQFKGVHHAPWGDLYPDSDDILFAEIHTLEPLKWAILYEAVRLQGAAYDWGGIWGHFRRAERQDDDEWYCTEYAAHCISKAGIVAQKMPVWKLTPFVFGASPIFDFKHWGDFDIDES